MKYSSIVFVLVLIVEISASTYCAFPSSYRATTTQKCVDIPNLAHDYFDIAAMKGEDEHSQLLIEPETGFAKLEFNDLYKADGSVFSSKFMEYKQVGFVFCEYNERVPYSGGGWLADPLLDIRGDNIPLSKEYSQTLYVYIHVPREISAGIYKGNVTLTINKDVHAIPMTIEVWDITVPTVADAVMSSSMVMETSSLNTQYPGKGYEMKWKYMDMSTAHRMPPSRIYIGTPRDWEELEYVTKTGIRHRSIQQVSNLWGVSDCQYTDEYVKKVIDLLTPVMKNLTEEGSISNHYVYGFDEREQSECEEGIRKLYGALKEAFPGLKTMAVLNWELMPIDLPVDIWVLQYQNSLANARLLFWYPMDKPVTGWLYYATVIYNNYPGRGTKPNTHRIGDTAFTDFPPANYIWDPRTDIYANGDGQWIYPGESGPIDSQRLCSLQDGMEDFELMKMLDPEVAKPLIHKLVRSAIDHTDDAQLLEQVRREAAKLILEKKH
ncbi:hypothetical protein WA158_007602 [Blastocystis sp. Blastoise]